MSEFMDKNNKTLRPAAVPLITVDPYFSVWSCTDRLYEDYTRHWSGKVCPMFAGVVIDGKYYSLMGVPFSDRHRKMRTPLHMEQESVRVYPLRTEYVFSKDGAKVTLNFITPLILDRPDIMSRPVSYIQYDAEFSDGADHGCEFVFGISGECAVDTWEQRVTFSKSDVSVSAGNEKQNVLGKTGDLVSIDWGYLHVADKNAQVVGNIRVNRREELCCDELDMDKAYNAFGENPYILVKEKAEKGYITLGYDEINPIEYFGDRLSEYYTKYFASFEEMLSAAKSEFYEIRKLCVEWEEKVLKDTSALADKYEKITSLAYRQAVGAHKLCEDKEGNIIFLSKECYSNGCIGTLDITYPSMPLFVKYNPELVFGMLRPIIKYAKSDKWTFDFAPHDVGQYPIVKEQVYYNNERKYQMPVEECGNAILSIAACGKMLGNNDFANENKEILAKWADYLLRKGYRPENQLCTDDFAGHLEGNCNLSVKGIMALYAFGKMFGEEKYMSAAKEMADKWSKEAVGEKGSYLAFEKEDTWGLKYNMVWDRILDFNLFDKSIYEKEAALYLRKMNDYGTPLDNRASYTKLDWIFWTTVLSDNKEYFEKTVDCVYDMICDTDDRVPLCDWYDTVTGKQCEFQNRTVVGGIFINLL